MQIQFKGTNYELTDAAVEKATKKLQNIAKYIGKTASEPKAYVDLGKFTEAHVNGRIYYADVNLEVEGKRFYARAEAETLKNAFDKMAGELAKELRTANKKHQSLMRRGGMRVKEFFQLGI